MTNRQYIGARYVPVFADPVEWNDERTYEALTMVQHVGETYMSRQAVPIGAQLPDTEHGEESTNYWVHMSNWNAQVETYRQEVLAYNGRISSVENALPVESFDSENTVKDVTDNLQNQIGSGFDATNTIAGAISSEETNRENQDFIRPIIFANVTAMKASDNLEAGMFCKTNGFTTSGDNGSAWYYITDTGTANERDVIACGSLYANLLVVDGYITPEMFGAIGDGATDDTDAIKAVFANATYEIVFGAGKTYLVSDEMTCDVDHRLTGKDSTIKFDEATTVTDIHLLQFDGLDSLVMTGMNFKIVCDTVSPFVDDNIENHDGILVHPTNCSNVFIDNCKFHVIESGKTCPCTPIWANGTGTNYRISNSELYNKGNASRSGALWFYGTITDVVVENCHLCNSTLDEQVVTWTSGTTDIDLTLTNCMFEVFNQNDQVFAVNDQYAHLYVYNSVIKQNNASINYICAKVTGGLAVFDGCEMELYGRSSSRAFLANSSGKLIVQNCKISLSSLTNNDNSLLRLNNGKIELSNNKIKLNATHHNCFLTTDNGVNDSELIAQGNYIEFDDHTCNSYIYGYKNVFMTGNIIKSNNASFLSYEDLQGTATRTKVMENNTFITSGYGTFWVDTDLTFAAVSKEFYIDTMQQNDTYNVALGTSTNQFDYKLVLVSGYDYARAALFILNRNKDSNGYDVFQIYGNSNYTGSYSSGNFVITAASTYASYGTHGMVIDLNPSPKHKRY